MKKKTVAFPSLSEKKYYTLSSHQLTAVLGGEATRTPGGSEKNGPTVSYQEGNRIITRTPIRSFSSDSFDGTTTCYEGLEECISETITYV